MCKNEQPPAQQGELQAACVCSMNPRGQSPSEETASPHRHGGKEQHGPMQPLPACQQQNQGSSVPPSEGKSRMLLPLLQPNISPSDWTTAAMDCGSSSTREVCACQRFPTSRWKPQRYEFSHLHSAAYVVLLMHALVSICKCKVTESYLGTKD